MSDTRSGEALAERVLAMARSRGWRLGTAESCTGGLIAGALTDRAGASAVFEMGLITYSNAAKTELLGVDPELFASVGAVSAEVALAMASGLLERHPRIDLAVSVTGIAGPGGATAEKPVGLVYIGTARRGLPATARKYLFLGKRQAVRSASVMAALELLTTELAAA